MTRLVVAAVSARLLAEAAASEGHEVIALDLFGDADTRRASVSWRAIGSPGTLRIDARLLLDTLAELAARGDVAGWVAGSGFEGDADLLERGAALLPLWGTPAAGVRRLRDARTFFAWLDAEGIAHPAVQYTPPADPNGWLVKDAGGCGGWHIRRTAKVAGRPLPASAYFQREVNGVPMSATFVADGRDACVLGLNRQLTFRIGTRPFVFRGVIGPLPAAAPLLQPLSRIVQRAAAEFGLRGLGSLDFLLDGDTLEVLEINPRPPASMALYPDMADTGGLGAFALHLRACRDGELPAAAPPMRTPRGTEIVFARGALHIDAPAAERLAAWPGCHDLPRAGSSFTVGDPVCSLEATGASADAVEAYLTHAREALLATLETTT